MSAETARNIGSDLIRVHKVISRAITISSQYSQSPGPEPVLREGFRSYERALGIFLNSHHVGEDDIAFPYIEKKAPNAAFNQLREEHRQIVVLLNAVNDWVNKDGAAWEAASLAKLNKTITDLKKIWYQHIALEEQMIGPEGIERLLTAEENAQLGEQIGIYAQQYSQPAELVLPFMLLNMPPEDRAIMVQGMPPTIMEQLIPHAWKATWAPMQPFLLD